MIGIWRSHGKRDERLQLSELPEWADHKGTCNVLVICLNGRGGRILY